MYGIKLKAGTLLQLNTLKIFKTNDNKPTDKNIKKLKIKNFKQKNVKSVSNKNKPVGTRAIILLKTIFPAPIKKSLKKKPIKTLPNRSKSNGKINNLEDSWI
jgi:hypothetical protein